MGTLTIRRFSAPLVLAATLLTAFVLLFAWPQSAAAHDSLIDSDPAADSTIETLPDDLTLTFSAALIGGDGSTAVVVTDAEGNSIADGAPTVDGAMVIQPLIAEAAAGEYNVLWQVVSSDGHPTDGEFSFTLSTDAVAEEPVASPSAEPEPSAVPEDTATEEPLADPDMDATTSISWPWIIGIAVVVLIIIVVVLMLLRRGRGTDAESSPGSDAPPER